MITQEMKEDRKLLLDYYEEHFNYAVAEDFSRSPWVIVRIVRKIEEGSWCDA